MGKYVDIVKEKALVETQTTSIVFNNHFAGFGPESASTFLKMMDKPAPDWTKEIEHNQNNHSLGMNDKHQTNMFDYTSFKRSYRLFIDSIRKLKVSYSFTLRKTYKHYIY
jgi:hypothetical protein